MSDIVYQWKVDSINITKSPIYGEYTTDFQKCKLEAMEAVKMHHSDILIVSYVKDDKGDLINLKPFAKWTTKFEYLCVNDID